MMGRTQDRHVGFGQGFHDVLLTDTRWRAQQAGVPQAWAVRGPWLQKAAPKGQGIIAPGAVEPLSVQWSSLLTLLLMLG
jgi:hypothetical protein